MNCEDRRGSVLFDVDNVVARTDEVIRALIFEKTQIDLRYEDVVEFDYWLCQDHEGRRIRKEDWTAIHLEFTRNCLDSVEPFDHVVEHLSKIRERFEIHLATSRLPEGRDSTIAWLQKHQIPYTEIHFVEHRLKHKINIGFVAAVDDDRAQAELFEGSGIRAFLLAHPWNVIPSGSRLRRARDWSVLVPELLALGCGELA